MANEISIKVQLEASKGGAEIKRKLSNKFTMSGDSFIQGVQEIETNAEVLTELTILGNPGWIYVKNLDGTNYVEFGRSGCAAGEYVIKLLPGEFSIFKAAGNIYVDGSGEIYIYT